MGKLYSPVRWGIYLGMYMYMATDYTLHYRKTSSIRSTKSKNFNVSRLVLQLFLSNPLKPGIKSTV